MVYQYINPYTTFTFNMGYCYKCGIQKPTNKLRVCKECYIFIKNSETKTSDRYIIKETK